MTVVATKRKSCTRPHLVILMTVAALMSSRGMMGGDSGKDGPGPIPQRWLECPRKSEGLMENKFLALKTPLSTKFNDQVPPVNRFTPSMLFQSMKSYNVKIGLWIDLTNTNRFYDKGEVESNGCRHVKLCCKGHGETPTKNAVATFNQICSTFISRFPTEIIAVHCTHGFNRTGFMVCSYFVEKEDLNIDYVINAFAKIRAPGIYKQDYLNELISRYGDIGDPAPRAPELPPWHTECDDTDRDEGSTSNGGGGGGGGGRKRGGREKNKANPAFMEGVSGVVPVTDPGRLATVRRRISDLCYFSGSGFPGLQPVSMSRSNINMLRDGPYYVSWKADGTRYMMLIDGKGEIYFSDRDNSIFHAPQVEFRNKENLMVHLKETLLDGEMVIDTDPVTKQQYPRYLIYDAIRVHGKDVIKDRFWLRWERIQTDVIRPRHAALKQGIFDKNKEPFGVRRKDFWEANELSTGKLLSANFRKQLLHEPDGLIFQPDMLEYVTGRCDEVLKWKPPSHNSVDFKLKIVTKGGEGLLTKKVGELYVGGMDHNFAEMKYTSQLKDFNNKIIECAFSEMGQWIFMRERTDKSFPNSFNTAQAVVQTIREPVTEQILLEFLHTSGYKKPDGHLMPPPSGPGPLHHQPHQPPPPNNRGGSGGHNNQQNFGDGGNRAGNGNNHHNASSNHGGGGDGGGSGGGGGRGRGGGGGGNGNNNRHQGNNRRGGGNNRRHQRGGSSGSSSNGEFSGSSSSLDSSNGGDAFEKFAMSVQRDFDGDSSGSSSEEEVQQPTAKRRRF